MTRNTEQLEKLLREHMVGTLSTSAYRHRRAQYINNYIHQCESQVAFPQDDDDKTAIRNRPVPNKKQQAPQISSHNTENGSSIFKLIALSLLIAIAIGAWYIAQNQTNSQENTKPAIHRDNDKKTVNIQENNDSTAAALFVFRFIEKDNWSSSELSDFAVEWQSLSRKEQTKLRKTKSFSQLSDTLRDRINEQKALSETNEKAKQQVNLLMWFSSQLSISVN